MEHRDASITLRVYAHYTPSASLREVDRLDALQPSAKPAQPEAGSSAQPVEAKSFGMSGEPEFHELEPDLANGSNGWRRFDNAA
jgi:hypothetical protein